MFTKQDLCAPRLPWLPGGIFLALAFFLAIFLVKPIGVSTQFVIFDGVVWDLIDPDFVTESADNKSGYASPNAYINKSGSKYAGNIADPLNYSFVFVLAMMGGAFLSSMLGGEKPQNRDESAMPAVWRERFGDSATKRYIWSFIAGFLVLFGARLAGGCTSGHMMSGMMQTALSGYIFALGAFLAAIPLAFILYNTKK